MHLFLGLYFSLVWTKACRHYCVEQFHIISRTESGDPSVMGPFPLCTDFKNPIVMEMA